MQALIKASRLLPYDSAIFLFSNKQKGAERMEGDDRILARTLLGKRIKVSYISYYINQSYFKYIFIIIIIIVVRGMRRRWMFNKILNKSNGRKGFGGCQRDPILSKPTPKKPEGPGRILRRLRGEHRRRSSLRRPGNASPNHSTTQYPRIPSAKKSITNSHRDPKANKKKPEDDPRSRFNTDEI